MVELFAMVGILGCLRAPAVRFAVDRTRPTSLERLSWCLNDLGGVTREILTDRDPAFCIGSTSEGAAILAPEWSTSAVCSTWCRGHADPTGRRPRARWSGWSASSGSVQRGR